MSFLNKELQSIKVNDLQDLIDNQVREGKNLEYKESLPDNTDASKKEFLADVSSFSNTSGGHLIFGIRETDGLPSDLLGLSIANIDAEILRLENIIRDGIEPRISNISFQDIPLKNSKNILILYILRSWELPHMVIFGGHSRFYARNSAGKYPLDVAEIRSLFLLSETTSQQIRSFRYERISNIISGETPIALNEGPKIVLHIIPLSSFGLAKKFDLSSPLKMRSGLRPINASGWNPRYNFDGFLAFAQPVAYTQIFHNGIIEAVNAEMIGWEGKHTKIPSKLYEMELIRTIPTYLEVQQQIGVEPPFLIFLSLLGVRGYTMAIDTRPRRDYPINRDNLIIPEVLMESYEVEITEVMRPIFDQVWNATGWQRSFNYDEDGNWRL